MTGRTKFWNDVKGFGFITPDGGGKDIFVHYTGIAGGRGARKSLEQGQKVEFTTEEGEKGPKAVNVTLVA